MKNRTVVLATHHLSLCLPKASYLVKLANGQIVWQGDVNQNDHHLEQIALGGDARPLDRDDPDSSWELDIATSRTDTVVDAEPHRGTMKGRLVEEEHRAFGRVSIRTYLTYIRAAGWIPWLITLCFVALQKLIALANTVCGSCDTLT